MSENKRKTVASKAEGRTEKTREKERQRESETEVIREPRNGSQVATKQFKFLSLCSASSTVPSIENGEWLMKT